MEQSRAQLDEPRCAVQMAAPHRLLAGRVQQHRRGLRGGMTARPIFSRGAIGSVREQAGHAELACVGLEPRTLHQVRVGPRAGRAPQGEAGTFFCAMGWVDASIMRGRPLERERHRRVVAGATPASRNSLRRDSQPPALNKPGEGESSASYAAAKAAAASLAAPRLPRRRGADQHVRVAPTSYTACPRPAPPPIFSLLRCCETAPTGRGARIFLP